MLIQGNAPFQRNAPLRPNFKTPVASNNNNLPSKPPETGLPRFLNYYADYSGCGHWRMI